VDPALKTLAHEGTKAYQQAFDLLYRREAERSNAIWQADHSLLNIWLLGEQNTPDRPGHRIEDDFSRGIAGYFLQLQRSQKPAHCAGSAPGNLAQGGSPLHICGIPEIFYSDMAATLPRITWRQVCIDLKIQLVFSTVGMPRGRGRIERFFRTIDQLLLHKLPVMHRRVSPESSTLTLGAFEERFKNFLLDEYHQRPQEDLPLPPQARWEAGGFLPQMPESLEQLDLLLFTIVKPRQVQRDGIHFQGFRYMDVTLAALSVRT